MTTSTTRTGGASRADLIADAALALLAERGMRGLTHRAVDERAGLPQGSTSNYARTRQALLEATVRRLAEREAQVLAPGELPMPGARPEGRPDGEPDAGPAGGPPHGVAALVGSLASALHRYLTRHPHLLICRYELALEATRRPELREFFDATGGQFREPLVALMTAAGSAEPERHALSLVAWCEGLMFSCAAGSYHRSVPTEKELRTGFAELLRGLLTPPANNIWPGLDHWERMPGMTADERSEPAITAAERPMLEGWLAYHRDTLALKCAGLTDAQLREASVPPSQLSLLGLVRHMSEVERHWFRNVMAGEEAKSLYCTAEDEDGDFHPTEADTWEETGTTWRAEIDAAREIAAKYGLEDLSIGRSRKGEQFNLRWIYTHMIEEYARHNGHADLVRERIDGATGD